MTHIPAGGATPFSAAGRFRQLEQDIPFEGGIGNAFRAFMFGVDPRVTISRRNRLQGLQKQEDTAGQLEQLRIAIAEGQAQGLPPRQALLQALTKNPNLLSSASFPNVDTLQKALKPAAAVQAQPGTQLLDPATGAKRGEQVPFKEELPPADERMVNAILEAREGGDEPRARLLTAALIKDNTTTLSKNVAEVFQLRAKAEELKKTPGKEKEAGNLNAQADLLEETLKSTANQMAEFFKNFFPERGEAPQAGPTGPEPPLAGAAQQGAPAVAPAPTGGLTQSDQQILALPLAEIEQRQLVALLSRPAGIEAFRAKLAQERLQAVPGGGPTVPGTTGEIAPGPALGGPGAP